ncbi:Lcl domain-containing protein [Syntrophobacter fumaroxidans]|uniref:Conserved repeat domain n=1 Tax=Syntrophobacter fumaroxidans (strain DSM 10017 / MPOB) TaxID=335543 RepID=A0LGF3_SYNFM|nr:DUF1566 domain-containing protein [Syntrophobacter fumaroxidans]ABK16505.1 conserved repeat domain [Syntrophobacter fumaroxidans MPOB]
MKRFSVCLSFLIPFIGLYLSLVPAEAGRFVDSGDGTVSDVYDDLMFQKIPGKAEGATTWEEYRQYCEDLELGGHNDWRIPRIDEIQNIMRFTGPGKVHPFFGNVFDYGYYYYGSSTLYAPASPYESMWLLRHMGYFEHDSGYGCTPLCPEEECCWPLFLCVRGGPNWSLDPSSRLVSHSANTVRDTYFKYIWQRSDDGIERTLDEALQYCRDLVLDGYDDWRLPDMHELVTIVDYTSHDPALPAILEGGAHCYSSSSAPHDTKYAWCMYFGNGSPHQCDKTAHSRVRCVRWAPRPIADFSADPATGYYPLRVNFKDETSGNTTSLNWDFGDGSGSTATNPSHTYREPGVYPVKLTAARGEFTDTKTKHYTVLNHAPSVSITTPVNQAFFLAPADISIIADANDADDYVKHVKFYSGTTLIKTDYEAPYRALYRNVPSGKYILTAVATDKYNAKTTSARITVHVRATCDLSLLMTGYPSRVHLGDVITYSMTVHNAGPDDATNVTLTDTLPSGLRFISVIPSQGTCTKSGRTISCSLGDLPHDGVTTVELVVKPTAAGKVSNRANVKATQADPDMTNNRKTVATSVVP